VRSLCQRELGLEVSYPSQQRRDGELLLDLSPRLTVVCQGWRNYHGGAFVGVFSDVLM